MILQYFNETSWIVLKTESIVNNDTETIDKDAYPIEQNHQTLTLYMMIIVFMDMMFRVI